MKILDIITYSFHTLYKRKKRTLLTMLGIIISIGSLVSIISLSNGFEDTLTKQFDQGFELNLLRISASSTGFSNGLTTGDCNTIRNIIPNVDIAMGINFEQVWVKNINLTVNVIGVNFELYTKAFPTMFSVINGSIPQSNQTQGLVIGYTLAKQGNISVGDKMTVNFGYNGTYYTADLSVSGILKEQPDFTNTDEPSNNKVYISDQMVNQYTNQLDEILIVMKDSSPTAMNQTITALKHVFPIRISIFQFQSVVDAINNIFEIISIFLGSIASISILVAGIGIINIMFLSVGERTREIGILKAVIF